MKRPSSKPPSRRRRERETAESRVFRETMAYEILRDQLEPVVKLIGVDATRKLLDQPCVVCGNPSCKQVGFWFPSPEIARKCGVPDDGTIAVPYRLCPSCGEKTGKQREWVKAFIEAKWAAIKCGESIVCMGKDGMPLMPWEESP